MCTRKITMPQPRARSQQQLFEEPPPVPAVRLPLDVQKQLRQALMQWMQALAKVIREEDDDE
jgi:BMFP domain-containing protein YqiC